MTAYAFRNRPLRHLAIALMVMMLALAGAAAAAAAGPAADVRNGLTDAEGDVTLEPGGTSWAAPDLLSVTSAYLDNADGRAVDDSVQSSLVVDASPAQGVLARIYAGRVVAWWIDSDGDPGTGYNLEDFGRGADFMVVAFGTSDGVPTTASLRRWSGTDFARPGTAVPLVATDTTFAWSRPASQIGAGRGRTLRMWVEAARISADGSVLSYDRAPQSTAEALTLAVPPPPPVAVTGDARDVGTATARVAGTVDAGGSDTQWFVRYGIGSVNDGSSVPQTVNGSGPVGVTADLTGLQPGTTYRFQVIARSLWGESEGDVHTLTTAPRAIPAAVPAATGPSRAVSARAATLVGEVGILGAPARWWFEWGTTERYGTRSAPVEVSGLGGIGAVTRRITGLSPDTDYHYRLVVESGGQRYDGDPEELRTAPAGTLTIAGNTSGLCSPARCTIGRMRVVVRGRTPAGTLLPWRTLRSGLSVQARCVSRCTLRRAVRLTGSGRQLAGDLHRLLRLRSLKVGATLEVRVTRAGYSGAVYRVTASRRGVWVARCSGGRSGTARCTPG